MKLTFLFQKRRDYFRSYSESCISLHTHTNFLYKGYRCFLNIQYPEILEVNHNHFRRGERRMMFLVGDIILFVELQRSGNRELESVSKFINSNQKRRNVQPDQ